MGDLSKDLYDCASKYRHLSVNLNELPILKSTKKLTYAPAIEKAIVVAFRNYW